MTYEEALTRAKADYAAAVDSVIRVPLVVGFLGDTDVQVERRGDIEVRIVTTHPEDLMHYVDEWLDPFWDVEILSPEHQDVRSAWTYGPSYQFTPR